MMDRQHLLELVNPTLPVKPGAATTGEEEMDAAIVAQVEAQGAAFVDRLVDLRNDDPGLYSEAMGALQGVLGNAGVDALHTQIDAKAGPAATTGDGGAVTDADPGRAAETVSLLDQLGPSMGIAGEAMDVRADSEAETRTEAAGASGLMDDGTVFLNPQAYDPTAASGKELLAHEMAHVAQGTPGRSGGAVTPSKSGAEAEAASIGRSFASGGAASAPMQRLPGGAKAADTDAAAAGEGSGGGVCPDKVSVRLAGTECELQLPSGQTSPEVTITAPPSPVAGVEIQQVKLTFDDSWSLEQGTMTTNLSLGQFVSMSGVELSINESGNVAASVPEAPFVVGSLFNGTISLSLGSEGISGSGSLSFDQVGIQSGFTLSGGSVDVAIATDGTLTAQGTLSGSMDGLGDFTLSASYGEGLLNGQLDVTLAAPLTVVDGVQITGGSIGGSYSSEGVISILGGVDVSVRDWANASVQVTYETGSNTWGASGTVNQNADLALGDLNVTNGVLGVEVANSTITEVTAQADYSWMQLAGSVAGTYDVGQHAFSGTGDVTLTEPLPVGEHVTVRDFSGTATVEQNSPTEVTAQATVDARYEGQETFVIEANGTYNVPAQTLNGGGTITTIRSLTFGDPGATHALVNEGATAEAIIENTELSQITGGLEYQVLDTAGELGTGALEASFEGGNLNADGSFTLTTDYGFPARDAGPLFIEQGVEVQASIVTNALETITVSGGNFHLLNPSGDGTGRIGGTFEGAYNVPSSEFSGTGSAAVVEDWPITGAWGEAVLTQGGSITVTAAANKLESFEGQIPFTAAFAGQIPVAVEGSIQANYSGETEALAGNVEATLTEEVTIPINADHVVLLTDTSVSATFAENQLESVTANLHAMYHREGVPLLEGHSEGASYVAETGMFSFDADFTLLENLEKSSADGTYTFALLAESTATVSVADNTLQSIGATGNFLVSDDAPLLEGTLSEATLSVADWKFSGNLALTTARDFEHPTEEEGGERVQGFQFVVQTGSGVTTTIAENELTEATADLNFLVNHLGAELAAGTLNGQWQIPEKKFTGVGELALTRDFMLGSQEQAADGRMESWIAFVSAGSGIHTKMTESSLERAQVGVEGFLTHNDTTVATGSFNGEYTLGAIEGFGGQAQIDVIAPLDWSEGERFHIWIQPGTTLNATLEQSALIAANGTFMLTAQEQGVDAIGLEVTADWAEGQPLSGSGSVEVLADVLVASPGGYSVYLATSSAGSLVFTNDAIESIGGTILLRLDDPAGVPTLQGEFNASYQAAEGADALINGDGTVEVLQDIGLSPDGSEYGFYLESGSNVGCTLLDSALDQITGQASVRVEDADGAFATATISDALYTHTDTNFSGTGEITVTRELDTGAVFGDYSLKLCEGTGAGIRVENNELQELNATVSLRIDDSEPLVGVDLEGVYNHPSRMFDGTGTMTLLRQVTVAENVGSFGYSFFLEPEGTTATATVTQNQLTEATGALEVTVHDIEGEFLRGQLEGTWINSETPTITVTGSADVTREKQLAATTTGYQFWLTSGSVEAVVTDNTLDSISGTLTSRLDKDFTPFASLTLEATYSDAGGVDGTGEAELLQEFLVAQMGEEYALYVEPGAGAKLTLAATELVEVSASIPVRIDENGNPFIRGALEGTYDVPNTNFTGTGTCEVLNEKQLAELNGQTLFLCPGTGAEVGIADNALQTIGGNIVLSLRDESGEYVVVQMEGSFDAAGGTGFSGGGSATVNREKCLFGTAGADYSFWLIPGAGAEATIAENALTHVGGTVPFQVQDAVGPLIEGHAEGDFEVETGVFNGTGGVYLGRDLDFQVTDNTLVKFKQGSGGEGEVVNNELRKLGGTLTCEIIQDGEPLVRLSASGEYDAVENSLLWCEGSAELLRPFEMLDGGIIIEGVTGTARIENNELVSAGGEGSIRVPMLPGDVNGTFNIAWRNEGGRDVYSGGGEINFTIFDDPETGRKMSGMVAAQYNEDDTFHVEGEVDFDINPMLGGSLGVAMDMGPGVEPDPVFSGTMECEGELVQGRDLFNLEIPIIPHTPVNFGGLPITMFFGAMGGMGLEMLPLTFAASVGVDNFRPMSQEADVPDFEAMLELNWGLNFNALLAAYMSLELGYPGFAAGGGVRGEAELNAPLEVQPYGVLRGSADGFGGELGIGISLAPTMDLRIILFASATLGAESFQHDLATFEYSLGELFRFEWGTKYMFGDPAFQGTEEETPVDQGAPAAEKKDTEQTAAPTVEPASASGAENVAGGPQLESGQEVADQQAGAGGGDGAMGDLMEKIEDVKVLAGGLQALMYLGKVLAGCLVALATFGPAGLVVYIVFEAIFGDLSWDAITEAVDNLQAALSTAAELLEPFFPSWLNDIIKVFTGEKPGLWAALTGADDAMRDAVHNGDHLVAPTAMRAKMCEEMLSGWTGEADQECILKVLEESARKGDLAQVVSGAGGADWFISDLDGYEDTRACELFDNAGISYDSGW